MSDRGAADGTVISLEPFNTLFPRNLTRSPHIFSALGGRRLASVGADFGMLDQLRPL